VFAQDVHADAASSADRERFQRAYHAFLNNEVARGEALSAGLNDYLLYPRLQYESLRRRVEKADVEAVRGEVQQFLKDNSDTHVGELLRTQWLTLLAKRQRWRDFMSDYAPQEKLGLRCAHFAARAAGVTAESTPAMEMEARELWLSGESLPPECDAVGEWLTRNGVLTPKLLWERIGLAMAEGNVSLVGQLAARLPVTDQHRAKLWLDTYKNPAKAIASPELSADSEQTRAILRTGFERLARQNAGKANSEWRARRGRYHFSADEAGAIATTVAIAAVRQDRADALIILDDVPADYVSADLQRAQLTAALEHRNWDRLRRWTEQPPAADMNALRWRYWRARALEAKGEMATARQIYLELSAERDYYGLMSAERLGIPYTFAHQPLAVTATTVKRFLNQPGIQRATELRLLGFEPAARQEWSFEMSKLDKNGLLEAAAAAHSLNWHERAIAALGKAREFDDLEIRYPIAFKDLVHEYAARRGLEPAVMFSLIRSESAFNETARSPAGALGLMQVMPATGKLTAKRIGMSGFKTASLLTAEDNVMIGSAYLRDMLDRFDGNLAMAAAAYNAGPHRVKTWRPQQDCIEADIWVDTIPFTETRRYVRNVLFVTALYQMRLRESVKPLMQRVAAVHAEAVTASSCRVG
jgi:soluble lytic murein transglycosylase